MCENCGCGEIEPIDKRTEEDKKEEDKKEKKEK